MPTPAPATAWTPSDYIAAGGVLVAILGLVVAALTLVFGYLAQRHAKSESYRAALYAAELSLVSDLMRAMAEAHLAAKRWVVAKGDDLEVRLNEFDAALRAVSVTRDAGVAVLREKVLRAIEADLRALFQIAFPPGDGPQPPADRRPLVEAAWISLTKALRAELGVDTLGDQVRELTGVAGREREELERKTRLAILDLRAEVMTRRVGRASELYDERLEGPGEASAEQSADHEEPPTDR